MLQRYRKRSQQGFTLVETLVAIAVTAILAAVVTPSFLRWYGNKQIEDALAQVEGALKIVQSSSVRLSSTCTVSITSTTVSATPAACLPTGTRTISGVNTNITTESTGSSSVVFSSKGTATIVSDKSVIVIRNAEFANGGKMKCLVVSSGVGLMRTGNYVDSVPPTASSNVDDVENKCITPS